MSTYTNQYTPPIAFHPGETLKEKLEELGMGAKEFAIRSGKPEKTISAILNGDSSITAGMAVQFENVLKIPAHFWLNMQRNYDEFVARQKQEELLTESLQWAKKFPYADMVQKGFVSKQTTIKGKTVELLHFFSFSDHCAWENFYCNQQLKISFRISLAHTKNPYAISAWLRKGELQADELTTESYNKRKLKENLPKLKEIMAKHPPDFFKQLQCLCSESGVKVVYTPCIKKAPINGCTRWIKDTPLIQLTDRYKRNDVFWFTFFHEIGHVLLHGKKDIFLENKGGGEKNEKENEADKFAVGWLLSKEQEKEILELEEITDGDIIAFAKKFKTHPAIIIGRLQHEKRIPFSEGGQFIESLTLG